MSPTNEIIDRKTLNTHLAKISSDADTLLRHIREHVYANDILALEYIAEHIDDYFEHTEEG